MSALRRKVSQQKMKLAYVTPVFKKGDKLDSTNHRPNSVTPNFAKNFERLLLTQMMEFIDKHKIINEEQYGFQKKVCNRCSSRTGRNRFG